MYSFSEKDEETVVGCPYDNSHRMLRRRLQQHLLKCRLNFPNAELRKCPFNQTHLVPEPEYMHHVTQCTDQKLIVQYKYSTAQVNEQRDVKHEPIECDEDWDDNNNVK